MKTSTSANTSLKASLVYLKSLRKSDSGKDVG